MIASRRQRPDTSRFAVDGTPTQPADSDARPTLAPDLDAPSSPSTLAPSTEQRPDVGSTTQEGGLLADGTPTVLPAPPGVATPSGYMIVDRLGEGGMGVVFLAQQTKAGRLVALKMIRDCRLVSLKDRLRFQ